MRSSAPGSRKREPVSLTLNGEVSRQHHGRKRASGSSPASLGVPCLSSRSILEPRKKRELRSCGTWTGAKTQPLGSNTTLSWPCSALPRRLPGPRSMANFAAASSIAFDRKGTRRVAGGAQTGPSRRTLARRSGRCVPDRVPSDLQRLLAQLNADRAVGRCLHDRDLGRVGVRSAAPSAPTLTWRHTAF